MTRKINRDFMFVIAVAVFLTVFFTTVLSYRSFQEEVFSELSSFAQMLEDLEILGQMKEQGFLKPEDELRITWIDQDGSVLYDSYADPSTKRCCRWRGSARNLRPMWAMSWRPPWPRSAATRSWSPPGWPRKKKGGILRRRSIAMPNGSWPWSRISWNYPSWRPALRRSRPLRQWMYMIWPVLAWIWWRRWRISMRSPCRFAAVPFWSGGTRACWRSCSTISATTGSAITVPAATCGSLSPTGWPWRTTGSGSRKDARSGCSSGFSG